MANAKKEALPMDINITGKVGIRFKEPINTTNGGITRMRESVRRLGRLVSMAFVVVIGVVVMTALAERLSNGHF